MHHGVGRVFSPLSYFEWRCCFSGGPGANCSTPRKVLGTLKNDCTNTPEAGRTQLPWTAVDIPASCPLGRNLHLALKHRFQCRQWNIYKHRGGSIAEEREQYKYTKKYAHTYIKYIIYMGHTIGKHEGG